MLTNPVLVEATRGELTESSHRGSVAVVDADGALVFSVGEIDRPIFPRSAVKALQALPLLETGAAEKYALTNEEIALACASHNGEPDHVRAAQRMLRKAGLDAKDLECGAHWPMYEPAARALERECATPSALHNNCSGKHAGFICLGTGGLGIDPSGYSRPSHEVQSAIRTTLEEMTDTPHTVDAMAVDGCSIPTYAVPLRALALGFARFGTGHGLGPIRSAAAARIRHALTVAPFMLAGTKRFDTEVVGGLRGRAFTKVGAEGAFCASLPEAGLGIALKMDDGAARAAEVVMAAMIVRFLELNEPEFSVIRRWLPFVLTNWNGIEVGLLRNTKLI